MKEYLTEMVIACWITALLTAPATWYVANLISQDDLQQCNANTAQCLERESTFCAGEDMGGVRLTTVSCDGKQELCVCGAPSMLKSGGSLK